MSERKHTDEEVIKGLECCKTPEYSNCKECPMRGGLGTDCLGILIVDTLDLINRQKAKIESLENSVRLQAEMLYEAKAETIKEFAERLKETPIKLGLPLLGLLTKSEIEGYFNHTLLQVRDAIDNLVAEMTEGK